MSDCLKNNPFDGTRYTGVRENIAKFFSMRGGWEGKHIVDLSCGDGATTFMLRRLGAKVTPYELIPDWCKLDDKPFYADVQAVLPIEDASVDVVVLQEVIEHLPNQLFTLQEICRILKPGGELFITTPSRSSIQSRLSYLVFESEHLRSTPWSHIDGVWGKSEQGEKYFGHLWLIGVQQLNTLGKVAGFKRIQVHMTAWGKTSVALVALLYPVIFLLSLRALYRDVRKMPKGSDHYREKLEQFKLNISLKVQLSKYAFVSLYK